MLHDGYSDGMSAERLMRNVMGDKYRGRATPYHNPAIFKRDLKKLITKLVSDVDSLIASENFKLSTKNYLENIYSRIGTANSGDDFRILLVDAFHVITSLLGYHYQAGKKYEEPYFIPTVWDERQGYRDALGYYEYEDKLEIRKRELILQLRAEDKTYAEIAKIMNISSYSVAQIVRAIE